MDSEAGRLLGLGLVVERYKVAVKGHPVTGHPKVHIPADLGVRALLDDTFARLDLIDPEHHIRDAIACYGLDTVVDAIAIFDGKRTAGTLPEGADARYVLGIVRNLHHCHEADAITIALLRERLAARDRLLQPLVRERDAILAGHDDDHPRMLDTLVDRITVADRLVDRHIWLDAAAVLPAEGKDRLALLRRAARRIHTAFHLRFDERSALERGLLRRVWPLS